MGFDDINVVAHQMEDLLIAARDEGMHLERAALNLLFEGLDVISTLVDAAVAGQTSDIEIDALCRRLELALHAEASVDSPLEASVDSPAQVPVLGGEEADSSNEDIVDRSELLSSAKEVLEELNEQLLKLDMGEEKNPVLNQALSIVRSFRGYVQNIGSQLTSLHISGILLRMETIFQIAHQELSASEK